MANSKQSLSTLLPPDTIVTSSCTVTSRGETLITTSCQGSRREAGDREGTAAASREGASREGASREGASREGASREGASRGEDARAIVPEVTFTSSADVQQCCSHSASFASGVSSVPRDSLYVQRDSIYAPRDSIYVQRDGMMYAPRDGTLYAPRDGTLYALPPLFLAVSERKEGLARWLLEYGADPNKQDNEGNTPLHVTARMHDLPCAALLIEFGGKVHVSNHEGVTPCQLAPELAQQQIRLLSDTLHKTSRPHKRAEHGGVLARQCENIRLRMFRRTRPPTNTRPTSKRHSSKRHSNQSSSTRASEDSCRHHSSVSGDIQADFPSGGGGGIEPEAESGSVLASSDRWSYMSRIMGSIDSRIDAPKVRA
jgi:hypothetical protein